MADLPVQDHHTLWRKVGDHLVRELESLLGSNYLDSGIKGSGAEANFRDWLRQWLPGRVSVVDGVVVDMRSMPTTQRDVLIFDSLRSPIFRDGSNDAARKILPIEGVLGAVEVNASIAKVAKLLADIDKLAAIKRLTPQESPPQYRAFGPSDANTYSLYREYAARATCLALIFAIDCEVSLDTLAEHVARRNLELGVDSSVDGIFVLRKGYILHSIEHGWVTARQNETMLSYMSAEPWDVLLTLVSTVNQHLALGSTGSTPSLEEYFSPTDGSRRTTISGNRRLVDLEGYFAQRSARYQSMR